MANPENKQIPYESTQQDIRDAIESVATAIGGIAIPSADHVSYDNSGSGLSATDVQNALDEIVSDIPTVNNGTLTIQQNGTSIGSFSANTASNVTADIKTPTADKKTATSEFDTANGGLLSKCQINLVPVQSGSGDPSPDNVRPISGHTEVGLLRVGKNLYNGLSEIGSWVKQRCTATFNGDGSITATNTQSGSTWLGYIGTVGTTVNINNCPCSKGDSFIVTSGNDTVCSNISLGELDSNNILLKVTAITSGATYTVTEDDTTAIVLRYNLTLSNGATGTIYPMIRKSTDTDPTFEPYLGHLYQVQIGSTVYGGYVDLVSGVMIAEYASVDLGSLTWKKNTGYGAGFFYADTPAELSNFPSVVRGGYNGTCEGFKVWVQENNYNSMPSGNLGICNSIFSPYKHIGIKVDAYADYDASQVATALSGIKLCYPLASPQTIQLTPQQIETLAGQNNLSTPLSGQSIETNGVEYKELFTFADVRVLDAEKTDISAIGTDENGRTTASRAYVKGEHFYKDGKFCTALTNIASGATFTLGTNYAEGDVASSLVYKSGDTFTIADITSYIGICGGSGTVLRFLIPLSKPVVATSAGSWVGIKFTIRSLRDAQTQIEFTITASNCTVLIVENGLFVNFTGLSLINQYPYMVSKVSNSTITFS